MSDVDKILKILGKNSSKSFVKRIISPDDYPVLKNPDGTVSTHSMAWGEGDGRYFVYPTVVWQGADQMKRLSDEEAWNAAVKTGNYIEFSSPEEAEWFSQNYKKVWEK